MGDCLRLAITNDSRIHSSRSALHQLTKAAFQNIHRTSAHTHADWQNSSRPGAFWIKLRITQRHLRSGESELGVSRHPTRFPFARHIIQRIEIFYLPGDPAAVAAGVESCDRTNSALACD